MATYADPLQPSASVCACRYISSVYWAYTTMTTVGYGDIAGSTIAEKVRGMVCIAWEPPG